ncbi:hypothetical protein WME79_03490 [Sorangium sp. So ce726]|uniref:hypothetical protein n=1 Tax=Sorangium sp. So ce726 TaxID=3133319 RepID=UPI003F62CC57
MRTQEAPQSAPGSPSANQARPVALRGTNPLHPTIVTNVYVNVYVDVYVDVYVNVVVVVVVVVNGKP